MPVNRQQGRRRRPLSACSLALLFWQGPSTSLIRTTVGARHDVSDDGRQTLEGTFSHFGSRRGEPYRIPLGIHPPPATQIPPPIDTNGSGVEQPVGGGSAGSETGTPGKIGNPGGSHPPLTHDQSGPGLIVVQATGGESVGAPGALGTGGAGADGAPPGIGNPGGSHPPLTHDQSGPGLIVVHEVAAAGGAFGAGVGAGAGAGVGAGAAPGMGKLGIPQSGL